MVVVSFVLCLFLHILAEEWQNQYTMTIAVLIRLSEAILLKNILIIRLSLLLMNEQHALQLSLFQQKQIYV